MAQATFTQFYAHPVGFSPTVFNSGKLATALGFRPAAKGSRHYLMGRNFNCGTFSGQFDLFLVESVNEPEPTTSRFQYCRMSGMQRLWMTMSNTKCSVTENCWGRRASARASWSTRVIPLGERQCNCRARARAAAAFVSSLSMDGNALPRPLTVRVIELGPGARADTIVGNEPAGRLDRSFRESPSPRRLRRLCPHNEIGLQRLNTTRLLLSLFAASSPRDRSRRP